MGNLCECMKFQAETSRESTPLISRDDVELWTAPSDAMGGATNCQPVSTQKKYKYKALSKIWKARIQLLKLVANGDLEALKNYVENQRKQI